jgi:hypothetical protein
VHALRGGKGACIKGSQGCMHGGGRWGYSHPLSSFHSIQTCCIRSKVCPPLPSIAPTSSSGMKKLMVVRAVARGDFPIRFFIGPMRPWLLAICSASSMYPEYLGSTDSCRLAQQGGSLHATRQYHHHATQDCRQAPRGTNWHAGDGGHLSTYSI